MEQDDLSAAGLPSLKNAQLRHMRQLFLTVVTGGFVVLVPWIVYLAVKLPDHHPAERLEIPLALYLFYAAMRIVRMTVRSALMLAGHPGPVPGFHKLSIGGLNELLKAVDARREQS